MYTKAIPTTYKGINMRSLAEARWAAFFDEIGWKWDYEPIELDGYIPDFILDFPKGQMLVEVKGGITPGNLDEEDTTTIKIAASKIINSGWGFKPSMICPAFPWMTATCLDRAMCLGWTIEVFPDPPPTYEQLRGGFWTTYKPRNDEIGLVLAECGVCLTCNRDKCGARIPCDPKHFAICSTELSYTCLVCGEHDGNPVIDNSDDCDDMRILDTLWRRSKNKVQWKGRGV